jgi:hypothetical protein
MRLHGSCTVVAAGARRMAGHKQSALPVELRISLAIQRGGRLRLRCSRGEGDSGECRREGAAATDWVTQTRTAVDPLTESRQQHKSDGRRKTGTAPAPCAAAAGLPGPPASAVLRVRRSAAPPLPPLASACTALSCTGTVTARRPRPPSHYHPPIDGLSLPAGPSCVDSRTVAFARRPPRIAVRQPQQGESRLRAAPSPVCACFCGRPTPPDRRTRCGGLRCFSRRGPPPTRIVPTIHRAGTRYGPAVQPG